MFRLIFFTMRSEKQPTWLPTSKLINPTCHVLQTMTLQKDLTGEEYPGYLEWLLIMVK